MFASRTFSLWSMISRSKASLLVLATLALSVFRSHAATNDYYTSPKAKALIDGMVQAYGGADKLKAIERVKVSLQVVSEGQVVEATIYQTSTKMRRDAAGQPGNMIEIYDGKNLTAILNGKSITPRPESQQDLANEVKEGVFQSALLDVFLNKDRHVVYRGKKTLDGKQCEVIETANHRNVLREHYIDPKSHREIARINHKSSGDETSIFEAFGDFKGVVYPSKVVSKRPDGSVSGRMRVVGITSDFDESVFVAPK